jgi:hypothetical protein
MCVGDKVAVTWASALGSNAFLRRLSTLSTKNLFITSAASMEVVVGPFALVRKAPQNLGVIAGLLEGQEVAILLVPPDES